MGYKIRITEPVRIEVDAGARDLCVLRLRRMLTLKTFKLMMRYFGLTPTKAMWVSGGVERKSYTIVKTVKKEGARVEVAEYPPEIADNKLFTTKYRFTWYARIEYDEIGHELYLEFTVDGEVEVHDFMAISENTIMEMLDLFLTELTYEYIHAFFTEYDLPMVTGFSDFEEIDEDIKGYDEMLSYDVNYVSVHIRRSREHPFRYRDDLSKAYEIYAYEALSRFIGWFLDTEREFLRREMEALRGELKKAVREIVISKYKTLARYAKDISELKKLEANVEKDRAEGGVTYDEYAEIMKILKERAKEIFSGVAMSWIKMLEACKSEVCVQNRMKEIKNTEIWKNKLFEEYKDIILDKEREVLNKIYYEALKKKTMPIQAIYSRVYTYFHNRINEEDTVKRIEKVIQRIEKSVIPEEMKNELISIAKSKINEIVRHRCESARKTIPAINKIHDLIEYRAIVKANRSEYGECYNEIIDMINKRIKELRKIEREEEIEDIVSGYLEEGITFITEIQKEIHEMDLKSKVELFKRLMSVAKDEKDVNAIANIFMTLGLSKGLINKEVSKKLGKVEEKKKIEKKIEEEKPDIKSIIDRYKEMTEGERIETITSMCNFILTLPEDEQYVIFLEAINRAESIEELRKISECINSSPYIHTEKFAELLIAIVDKSRELRR